MKTFRLKDLINNRNKPKIVKKILDSIELSKLDKKDILNDLKGIDKGGSVDDGMEYYEINNNLFEKGGEDIDNILSSFFITSIANGKLHAGVLHYIMDEAAYMCGNAKITLYNGVTAKNQLNTQLEQYGTSLNDTSMFKPITAEEYYSLINNNE